MAKKSQTVKKGRIRRTLSDWDYFWQDHSSYLGPPLSWQDARPELLLIARALQLFEPEQISADLDQFKHAFKEKGLETWYGNLSPIFKLLHEDFSAVEVLKNTVFDEPIWNLICTYRRIFPVKVPGGNLREHTYIYRAYAETRRRHDPVPLLSKFIVAKNIMGPQAEPFGLFMLKDREEILLDENAARITPLWILAASQYQFVDAAFSEFIWQYNIDYLPFMVAPSDLKKETKNCKRLKMQKRKKQLSALFDKTKKIPLMDYFSTPVAEVHMGFIGRQQYLMEKVIEQEQRHEGEIAESTVRVLYENRVKFLWLLKRQDPKLVQEFRQYKVGRDKLFLDHLKEHYKDVKGFEAIFEKTRKQFEQSREEEKVTDYKVAVERGDPFELNIAKMSEELGEHETVFYWSIYKRTSDVIHGNWRVLEKYHLERSLNPAQNGLLRYKSEPYSFAGLLPSFLALWLSADMMVQFFDAVQDMKDQHPKLFRKYDRFLSKVKEKYLEEFVVSALEGTSQVEDVHNQS